MTYVIMYRVESDGSRKWVMYQPVQDPNQVAKVTRQFQDIATEDSKGLYSYVITSDKKPT